MRHRAVFTLLAPLLAPMAVLCQTNLQFQDGAAGQNPPGWFVMDGKGAGYAATRQSAGCHGSSWCAVLAAPAAATADSFGTLMQSFAALPFHGQTVRLRAWVRLEKKAPGDRAQMLVHVGRPDLLPGFVDNMANRPIVTEEWGQYEIRGEVAADAENIQIGLTMYGSGRAWISGVEFGPVTNDAPGFSLDAARDAIQKQYVRMDAAFSHGDVKEISAILLPGAQMGVGTIREPLLPAIQAEIAKGQKRTARTAVISVRLDGDEAIVMVRRESEDPLTDVARKVVTSHRDTWVQSDGGWRWQESIEVSYHWVLPPTAAEVARPVVAELKTRAVPVSDTSALTPFGIAVGDARVVALGAAARGVREFAQWKQRLVEYLAGQMYFTDLMADPGDAEATALAERLHLRFSSWKADTPAALANAVARVAVGNAKVVLWTDNSHARVSALRDKFGRKLYAVGFAFDRGQVRAVGVENGESRGLGWYNALASPAGSGDAVLNAAGIPQFFLNIAKLPFGGALAQWLGDVHLFHDLGAYWVLDDPDASLQPVALSPAYDGLYYFEEVHSADSRP
jgi:hypothetical protein